MERIADLNIPCPICHHPDWCLMDPQGGAVICARIQNGSIKRCGQAGWLHIIDRDKFNPKRWTKMNKPTIDFTSKVEQYRHGLRQHREKARVITNSIGIQLRTAYDYDCGFDGRALTIPMHAANHMPIGIQRRFLDGTKRMVRGSKVGIFRPWFPPCGQSPSYLICEGFSDTATASELVGNQYHCIGKLNYNSGNDVIRELLSLARKKAEVVLLCDRDENDVGVMGAIGTAMAIQDLCWSIRILSPPPGVKDVRDWRRQGLTSLQLFYEIENTDNFLD